ncbi:mediator complex subunit 15 domain-containing protein [Selenomonas sputigena]|uniref:Uncharacterized protein n=1 Tax=Selenomonas sputigena (strain ATCC 35185 / DSM 20758 / CCUG 44933 / VPI D19B-28) TaxID=546271 RepID=F4EZU7_SELS3|nr:hypothetical protein [Selenomonas sputigena]AEB99854.1 hypothetical protein Selsp_0890 [Selenomonas sputigena ATCC 35185]
MAMEANAANAAGSLQRVQRPQTTGSADAVTRRGDGASSSPFTKETNVSIRNSIADLSSVLGKISQGQEDSVEVLPDHLQKVIRNVMESSFSLSATLEEGLGSTTESQRFSLEQLGTLSRMLTQLGTLAEKGVEVSGFSESMQTLLRNLKSLLTAQEGGSSLEPALLNKLSFQLLDTKALEDLPAALQQALTLLVQVQPQEGAGEASSFDFLKSLVQYFMPRPGEEGALPTMPGQMMAEDGADAEADANLPMRDAGEGGAKAVQQEAAGQMPRPAGDNPRTAQQEATQGNFPQSMPESDAAQGKSALQQSVHSDAAAQQSGKGAEAGLLPNAEDGASEATQQQKGSSQGAAAEGKGQAGVPQEQNGVQQKGSAQGGGAEGKGQPSEQMMRNVPQDGSSSEFAGSRQDGQSANSQMTRRDGSPQNTAQEKTLQQGQSLNNASASMQQGEAKSATRQMPVMQNTPQLMQSLKDTAAFMLKNMPLTEKDAALLRDFVNNGQKLLPDKEAKQLQLLLRLSQNNVPAAVNQAAAQKNLGDLPRLWAFMQLCDMTAVKDMKEQQLKRAGKDVAEFAASMKRSMEGGSLFQTDGKGNTHRSLNFMMPLYMGEGEKQSFPAYANVYNEEKYSPEDGRMHKETWLRLCVLTDHIGAVELTCQVYDAKSLNMRVLFSEPSAVEDFKAYIPEFRESFRTMTLELSDLKVSVAGSKE